MKTFCFKLYKSEPTKAFDKAQEEYEASKFGTEIIKVNRYFASSQICHCCGYQNAEVKDFSIREWHCPKYGAEHENHPPLCVVSMSSG